MFYRFITHNIFCSFFSEFSSSQSSPSSSPSSSSSSSLQHKFKWITSVYGEYQQLFNESCAYYSAFFGRRFLNEILIWNCSYFSNFCVTLYLLFFLFAAVQTQGDLFCIYSSFFTNDLPYYPANWSNCLDIFFFTIFFLVLSFFFFVLFTLM